MDWEEPVEEKKQGVGLAGIGSVFFILMTVGLLLCYLVIFVNPQIALNPFKPPVVDLPTVTLVAQATEVPPTFTPPMTFPPTWTPTATPIPTSTRTPTPTPTPTFTPGPVPPFSLYWDPIYTKQTLYGSGSGTWWTGVAGEVADGAGRPVTNVVIRIWDDDGHVWESKPGDASAYAEEFGSPFGGRGTYAWWERFLETSCKNSFPVHVRVYRNGQPVSKVVTVQTTGDCEKNLILVHFKQNY